MFGVRPEPDAEILPHTELLARHHKGRLLDADPVDQLGGPHRQVVAHVRDGPGSGLHVVECIRVGAGPFLEQGKVATDDPPGAIQDPFPPRWLHGRGGQTVGQHRRRQRRVVVMDPQSLDQVWWGHGPSQPQAGQPEGLRQP